MRLASCLSLIALAAGSCQREQPQGAEAKSQADAASTASDDASVSSADAAPPACVVPLASEPPATQKPAASCPADTDTTPPELTRGYVTFKDAPGAPRIGVELADSDAERERGLMYRTSMPEEQGMLFSWTDERVRTFWMHNTCIPLDMLFITKDGFISGILEQVPVMNDQPRSVPCPVSYVLEVNAGYCRLHGIAPGGKVGLE